MDKSSSLDLLQPEARNMAALLKSLKHTVQAAFQFNFSSCNLLVSFCSCFKNQCAPKVAMAPSIYVGRHGAWGQKESGLWRKPSLSSAMRTRLLENGIGNNKLNIKDIETTTT